MTNGAGNFTVWAHRFYGFRRYRTQLAPTSGAMGYGAPRGGRREARASRARVVCIAGDGDFLMTGQELATAVQYDAAGRRRSSSTTGCTGRSACTRSVTTRGGSAARTCGTPTSPRSRARSARHGERVERTADVPAALDRALAAGVPAVLHVPVDPEAITPRKTLTEIRAEGGG